MTPVWKKYISPTEIEGKCFVGCGTSIQINNFEAGHVIPFSNGGDNTIDNLRPICSLCNKSMGTMSIDEWTKLNTEKTKCYTGCSCFGRIRN